MALLYSTVITDICSQLGDPNEDTYGTRAKDHLQAAISQLIKDKQYTQIELPGYVKRVAIDFDPNPCVISSYNVIEIISVVPKYDIGYATNPYFMAFKDLTKIGGIHGNEEEQPTDEDVLIILYGNNLEAIIKKTIGDDKIVNGAFAADTDWTKGTGWTIAAGIASCDASQVADTDLTQTVAPLTSGLSYLVKYTISNYVAGLVCPVCGTQEGIDRNASGTYTETVVSNGTAFSIRGNLDFDGDIDNVYCYELTVNSNFALVTKVYMFYIEDPDITGFTTEDMLDYFRMSFIQRAKLLAIQMLKVEDELTN